MFNKKALGIHWIFLILAAGVSIVLCLGSSRIGASVPDVGNFPIQLSMELEKNSNTFLIIDSIMKQIAKQTIDKLSELESTEALDLTSEFEDIFEEKYSQFKEKKFEEFNLDFSDVIYEFNPIDIKIAKNDQERDLFWKARKGVLGALGRIAPNYFLVDGTVPRTKLSSVLSEVSILAKKYNLIVANVLHAGDGNLHPCIIFDQQIPGNTEKALKLGGDILKVCVENGGVLSGEHGIGYEKRDYMPLLFSETDLNNMKMLKNIFDPEGLFNPGKIFPVE